MMINLLSSIIICDIFKNNWFISVTSSIIVAILTVILTNYYNKYSKKRHFVNILINKKEVVIKNIDNKTIIELRIVLDENIDNEITLDKICNPIIKTISNDESKHIIIPEIELLEKELPIKINFNREDILHMKLTYDNNENIKIGLSWNRIVCLIDLISSKNIKRTLRIDLSDKFNDILINPETGDVSNQSSFIDVKHTNELAIKSESYEKNNKKEIENKIMKENPTFFDNLNNIE